jgi:hypothetical protein
VRLRTGIKDFRMGSKSSIREVVLLGIEDNSETQSSATSKLFVSIQD